MPFIGFILIAMAFFSVAGVLFMVVREHQEPPEEWFVPPSETPAQPNVNVPPPPVATSAPLVQPTIEPKQDAPAAPEESSTQADADRQPPPNARPGGRSMRP
jgi:hypothetical protein